MLKHEARARETEIDGCNSLTAMHHGTRVSVPTLSRTDLREAACSHSPGAHSPARCSARAILLDQRGIALARIAIAATPRRPEPDAVTRLELALAYLLELTLP